MSTKLGRWLDTGTDDCMCLDPSLEAAHYRAYMISHGFNPEPQLVMGDGAVIVRCENHRTVRFVKRKPTTITVTVSGGNRLERHV